MLYEGSTYMVTLIDVKNSLSIAENNFKIVRSVQRILCMNDIGEIEHSYIKREERKYYEQSEGG